MTALLTSGVCSLATAIATREYCNDNYRKMVDYVCNNPNCTWSDFSAKFGESDPSLFNGLKSLAKNTSVPSNSNQNPVPQNTIVPSSSKQNPSQEKSSTIVEDNLKNEIQYINIFGTNHDISELKNLTHQNIPWKSDVNFKTFLDAKMVPLLTKPHIYYAGPKVQITLSNIPSTNNIDQLIIFLYSLCNKINIL